ncbi:acyl carrier protein [Streptomyces sp. CoH27]|uniref:acyl carrier protein n=1 Tax=Streptomyces sp. CoH27 TaxID=2875763 RepID=UPI001CD7E30A|nr:acyl carrier protein [Streptomyces sp. CoH27]
MTAPDVPAAVREEFAVRGHALSPAQDHADLIGLGVNSVTLIQVLSALEDAFGIEFDMERLFSAPVSVARLETEIARGMAPA